MLAPRELYLAQGFPRDYVIHEIPDPKLLFVNGHQVPGDPRDIPRIPLSKTAQVRMRSEEHTSELQSLMRISYAVFCLKKKKQNHNHKHNNRTQKKIIYK